jgi:hypothetical protein
MGSNSSIIIAITIHVLSFFSCVRVERTQLKLSLNTNIGCVHSLVKSSQDRERLSKLLILIIKKKSSSHYN